MSDIATTSRFNESGTYVKVSISGLVFHIVSPISHI